MTTFLSCSSATYTVDPSSEPVGLTTLWIPLDAVTELWGAFGREATTPAATEATSQAFAALAEERTALRHYHSAHSDRRGVPDPPSWAEMFHAHEGAIEALSAAAIHWRNVVSALECAGNEWPQNEMIQQDMHALIGHALEERLRVWTIAQHLLAEQVTHYQQDTVTGPRTDRKEIKP